MPTSAPIQQWIRAGKLLLVTSSGQTALDLSDLRFKFKTEATDGSTPNIARIRVYNPKKRTPQELSEYTSVIINAGYENNIGQIFAGTIKQFRSGKENNVDSFLDIFAADTDIFHNYGFVNFNSPSGKSNLERFNQVMNALDQPVDQNAANIFSIGGGTAPAPRGKVTFGLGRSFMDDWAHTHNFRWSLQNGVMTVIPITGYLYNEQVEINSATGLIGVPEATEEGIELQCLLNPQLKVGQHIKLNNNDLVLTQIQQQFFPDLSTTNLPALPDEQGDYRIVVIEYEGDTRGQEWYVNLTCLAINPDVGQYNSVFSFCTPQSPTELNPGS